MSAADDRRPAANGAAPTSVELRRTDELRPHPQAGLVPAMAAEQAAAFRDDVAARGLLSPLEVTPAGVVLDGHERLRVARKLGIESVPVQVVAPEHELEHMLLCALQRRQLSQSQRAALVVELDRYRELRAAGEARRRQNLRQAAEVATLPPRGKTREAAAAWAGVSPRTVQDAATVREHDRALFERVKQGELAVDVAARRVRQARRDLQLAPAPPLPLGPFQLIYADPPWQLGNPDGRHAPENHYPTMPLAEICALSVPAAEDPLLLLWAVNCLLPQALEVIAAWGFSYRTNLVWVKPRIGLGNWARNRHELLLLARRGGFPLAEAARRPDSVIEAPVGRHSQKSACVYELIETAWPQASKLELFARNARPGWAAWGNQLPPASGNA